MFEELCVECGVFCDGSKVLNLFKVVCCYGLMVKGFWYDFFVLYELEMLCIFFWNFNYFLVFEGFKKGKVYLNDLV